jgi:hypothetical protein
MSNPGKIHWQAIKWIPRYLKGTSHHVLKFRKEHSQLQGYVDSDMAGDLDKRRSTTGMCSLLQGQQSAGFPECRR